MAKAHGTLPPDRGHWVLTRRRGCVTWPFNRPALMLWFSKPCIRELRVPSRTESASGSGRLRLYLRRSCWSSSSLGGMYRRAILSRFARSPSLAHRCWWLPDRATSTQRSLNPKSSQNACGWSAVLVIKTSYLSTPQVTVQRSSDSFSITCAVGNLTT